MSFKICVVGCGYMAFNGHGPSYKKYANLHTDVELAACCDIDGSKAALFQQEFGFSRHYTDMDLMLDIEKPQVVCLIVPEKLTFPLTARIFEKGYPLLLEKPPGLNKNETIEMIRIANNSNIPNRVAFNRRYMPLVGRLKYLLEQQHGFNDTLDIQYQMQRVGRTDLDFSTTAIHGIDIVRYLAASDYRNIAFHYQTLECVGQNVANIYMDCEFKSGAYAQLSFCPVSGIVVERLEVRAYQQAFYLNLPIGGSFDKDGKLLHIENGKVLLELSGSDLSVCRDEFVLSGFYNENEMFFEDIRNGRKPAGDIASGLQSVEIADCIRYRAAEYKNLNG